MSTKPRRRRRSYGTPHERAERVADAVMAAWWSSSSGGHMSIPIGTVAALALVRGGAFTPIEAPGPPLDPGDTICAQSPEQFRTFLVCAWGQYWLQRPDLVEAASIFRNWTRDADAQAMAAAHRVAVAAVEAGLMELVATDYLRHDVDLFAPLIEPMRSRGDKARRGEFYTPPGVAHVVGELRLGTVPAPGERILDPTSGSGGMFGRYAQSLRERGLDPAQYSWWANDIDPTAAAACAVNFILWDLGPATVVAQCDVLADPAGLDRAAAEAAAWRRHRDKVVDDLAFASATVDAVRDVERLIANLAGRGRT
ncbi:MAG: N-6 DNA methylase [Streptomycetaceae bacterium]|nr:N-6 DNA methylase [Streptomycetaceae bacterium]